jgi:hypothetical protein
MKLIQVIYELYQSDAEALKGHEDDDFHAIDREIRLCFEDHQSVWLSWSSEIHKFDVSFAYQPHLRGHIDKIIDMSNRSMWSRIIGEEITLTYCDTSHKVMKMSAKSGEIWCWVEGEYGSDVLHVSTKSPN